MLIKAVERLKMNIFWRKVVLEIFSGTSGISYCSKTCSSRPGLSIAPTPDLFGHVQAKEDTIKKRGLPQNPLKTKGHLLTFFIFSRKQNAKHGLKKDSNQNMGPCFNIRDCGVILWREIAFKTYIFWSSITKKYHIAHLMKIEKKGCCSKSLKSTF